MLLYLAKPEEGWTPGNWVTLVAAGTALIGAAVTAWFAYRTSVKTTRTTSEANERMAATTAEIERARVVAEAFNQAKAIYDHAITELREELDRVRTQYDRAQDQLDKLSDRLRAEQLGSQEVRDELSRTKRELTEVRSRLDGMERVMATLRAQEASLRSQLIAAGMTPAEAGLEEPV